jgi:hypothetical protein
MSNDLWLKEVEPINDEFEEIKWSLKEGLETKNAHFISTATYFEMQ